MKWNEAIFSAMTDVRDDLVEKSNAPAYPRSRHWRWVSMAACCALVLGAALALGTLRPREAEPTANPAPDPVPVTETAPETVPETVPEAEDWESPDYLAEFLAPQAVYFDQLSDDIIGPTAAVDDHGTVIAYTDCGTMWPLVDQSTGETLAVAVDERNENQTVPEADNRVTLYSLQGEVIQEVEAFYLSCLGDLVLVSRTGGTDLYRRDGTLVAEGLAGANIVGDDLLYTQSEDAGPVTVYDSTGAVVAEGVELQISYNTHVWQGHGYLCAMEGKQRGLLDSSGRWALEPQAWYIYGISQGYALCRDETSFYAVSLADGEVAFESPYGICAVYDQGLLLELDEASFDNGWVLPGDNAHAQFVAWDGTILAEATQIQVVDDEYDGTAELLLLQENGYTDLCRPDGAYFRQIDHSMGSISVLSSDTILCMNNYEAEDGRWLMDFFLLDVETGAENRDFGRPYNYGSGLWLTTDDSYGRFTTRLLYATYQDEAGFYHTDLLDESGQVLLTDLVDQYSQQKGGVFTVNLGGLPTLVRLDGTVLYPSSSEK